VSSLVRDDGEVSGASMSISEVKGELGLGIRPLILKIADSLPGPMPPRNLKLGWEGVVEGREM
jgi:hypothetical protein